MSIVKTLPVHLLRHSCSFLSFRDRLFNLGYVCKILRNACVHPVVWSASCTNKAANLLGSDLGGGFLLHQDNGAAIARSAFQCGLRPRTLRMGYSIWGRGGGVLLPEVWAPTFSCSLRDVELFTFERRSLEDDHLPQDLLRKLPHLQSLRGSAFLCSAANLVLVSKLFGSQMKHLDLEFRCLTSASLERFREALAVLTEVGNFPHLASVTVCLRQIPMIDPYHTQHPDFCPTHDCLCCPDSGLFASIVDRVTVSLPTINVVHFELHGEYAAVLEAVLSRPVLDCSSRVMNPSLLGRIRFEPPVTHWVMTSFAANQAAQRLLVHYPGACDAESFGEAFFGCKI